ncbi:MAG: hypothetical protein EOP06_00495 [Proteobacteria bacterium]|nr:MAG: hypothetical protein EOP06_00495 [Pseudomonadota bacterium]
MALLIANHYIEHRARIEKRVGSSVATPDYAAPTGYRCQVEPQSAGASFTATGVEMSRPHKVFIDAYDASNFKVGDLIIYDGEEFYLRTPVEVHKAFFGFGDYAVLFIGDRDGNEKKRGA